MKGKIQKPWSPEARVRHREGCLRYQRQRAINDTMQVVFDAATAIGVAVKPLLRVLIATDSEKLRAMVKINPRSERLAALREMVTLRGGQ